jgi:hypothetical protein
MKQEPLLPVLLKNHMLSFVNSVDHFNTLYLTIYDYRCPGSHKGLKKTLSWQMLTRSSM